MEVFLRYIPSVNLVSGPRLHQLLDKPLLVLFMHNAHPKSRRLLLETLQVCKAILYLGSGPV